MPVCLYAYVHVRVYVGRGLGRMSGPRDSDPEQLCALALKVSICARTTGIEFGGTF